MDNKKNFSVEQKFDKSIVDSINRQNVDITTNDTFRDKILSEEYQKEYFKKLLDFVKNEYKTKTNNIEITIMIKIISSILLLLITIFLFLINLFIFKYMKKSTKLFNAHFFYIQRF